MGLRGQGKYCCDWFPLLVRFSFFFFVHSHHHTVHFTLAVLLSPSVFDFLSFSTHSHPALSSLFAHSPSRAFLRSSPHHLSLPSAIRHWFIQSPFLHPSSLSHLLAPPHSHATPRSAHLHHLTTRHKTSYLNTRRSLYLSLLPPAHLDAIIAGQGNATNCLLIFSNNPLFPLSVSQKRERREGCVASNG
ncbi:MAG: hypothetical protein J3R72DRAFT_100989 [Linnemannia gamsii]|nr:MAG: hypothetical protein J3R72DRAFT_100989 [Linnemannia gamsii]